MDEAEHPTTEQVRPEAIGPNPRVMIADDNPNHVATTALLLQAEGYDVRGLPSGIELLEQFTVFCPTIVIVDIGMPGLTGYDVARALRANSQGAQVLLIAVTGYHSPTDRMLSKLAGFDYHLAKPVDPNALTAIIRDYLAGKRAYADAMDDFLALPRYPFNRAALEHAPGETGIYGLFDGDELIYIGRASDRDAHSIKSCLLSHLEGARGECTRMARTYTWEITLWSSARETEILARFHQANRCDPRCQPRAA